MREGEVAQLRWMRALAGILMLGGCATVGKDGATYLVSVGEVTLGLDEQMKAFSFDTWGVRFNAVCHVPPGWTITAGGGVTPDGEFGGHGSNGITWYNDPSPAELKDIVLITLGGPMQADDILDTAGDGLIPATFRGSAMIETDDGERAEVLTIRNVHLTPARHCPRG